MTSDNQDFWRSPGHATLGFPRAFPAAPRANGGGTRPRAHGLRSLLRLALALACCAGLLPGQAHGANGMIWAPAAINDTVYLPLENLRSFYKLMPKGKTNGYPCTIGNSDISISFGPGNRDIAIGGYRCRLTHPLQKDGNGDLMISRADMVKLVDPILRPTYIPARRTVRTVIIDPGHGGHEPGARTPYAREADITLQLAFKMKKELDKRGYQTILTRDQNRYLSDQQRIAFAHRPDSPIFISLHLNQGRSDIQGLETYSLAPVGPQGQPRPGNEFDSQNAALAFAVHAALVSGSGAKDGGCRRAHYSMLSSIACPAVLVELGYITHKEEGSALASDEYQGKLAAALANGIDAFARALAPGAKLKPKAEAATDAPPATYAAEPLPSERKAPKAAGKTGKTPRQTKKRQPQSRPARRRSR